MPRLGIKPWSPDAQPVAKAMSYDHSLLVLGKLHSGKTHISQQTFFLCQLDSLKHNNIENGMLVFHKMGIDMNSFDFNFSLKIKKYSNL